MPRMERFARTPQPIPLSGSWVFGSPPSTLSQAASLFGEWLVLRAAPIESDHYLGVPLARAEDVTRALRGALLHHAVDPPPALSGHAPDGRRLERAHAAFLALPDIRDQHSSSAVSGAAIVLPRDIAPGDYQAILLAAARWERSGMRLVLGRLGAMRLARDEDSGRSLDPGCWIGPARRWASVTPIALDKNPGDLSARNPAVAAEAARRAEEIVARACAHICLPRPTAVRVMRRSRFAGVPPAPAFMPFPRHGSGFKRVCVHVELRFEEPVAGPLLLGVGRHFGVGLCGPWRE